MGLGSISITYTDVTGIERATNALAVILVHSLEPRGIIIPLVSLSMRTILTHQLFALGVAILSRGITRLPSLHPIEELYRTSPYNHQD
jgi:hypothetical protein